MCDAESAAIRSERAALPMADSDTALTSQLVGRWAGETGEDRRRWCEGSDGDSREPRRSPWINWYGSSSRGSPQRPSPTRFPTSGEHHDGPPARSDGSAHAALEVRPRGRRLALLLVSR